MCSLAFLQPSRRNFVTSWQIVSCSTQAVISAISSRPDDQENQSILTSENTTTKDVFAKVGKNGLCKQETLVNTEVSCLEGSIWFLPPWQGSGGSDAQ